MSYKPTALCKERELRKKAEQERDEARAVAYDLAVIASHCLGSHASALLTETSERIAGALKRWRELKQ
jgi:gas vesicle protein